MMRSAVVFCLAVSFAVFGFGLSLQCYSCPEGSSSCDVKQQCSQGEDACLKLKSDGLVYTECIRYTDCSFSPLAVRYALPKFTYTCCQTNLCNGKSFFEGLFG
ncbi:CD59 glycoprotein-like [Betta splendens]|uniref:CD59 glycoprotein n=1 Tax=Betta splendens TaxID=158456 RepID=A0A6P7P1E9_BETSP|nr:CD59 glycoprotein-like [Betta splendens]